MPAAIFITMKHTYLPVSPWLHLLNETQKHLIKHQPVILLFWIGSFGTTNSDEGKHKTTHTQLFNYFFFLYSPKLKFPKPNIGKEKV